MKNVPKHVAIGDLWTEIVKIKKYSFLAAKDLAGIYIDVDHTKPHLIPDWHIYFLQLSSIEKLKRVCNEENGKLK